MGHLLLSKYANYQAHSERLSSSQSLDPRPKRRLDSEMIKAMLFALFVGLLMVGCGQDILHEAAEAGNLELIEKEIAEGANINSQNGRDGETPLQRAATRGQIEAAELLLSKGADVNIGRKRDGQTALDLAEDRGHEELAELLKKNGGRSSPDR